MREKLMVQGMKIGEVIDFSRRFMRALVQLEMSLRVGERVQIVGPVTDFRQTIESIEFSREKVQRGKPAQKVWIPVEQRTRVGDAVVLIEREDGTPPAGNLGG